MVTRLSELLRGHYGSREEPRVTKALATWRQDPELGNEEISVLLDEVRVTMDEIRVRVFSRIASNLQMLEQQLARHEKNVRESLKMIDARRNHTLMRERVAFDLERDRRQQISEINDDG